MYKYELSTILDMLSVLEYEKKIPFVKRAPIDVEKEKQSKKKLKQNEA